METKEFDLAKKMTDLVMRIHTDLRFLSDVFMTMNLKENSDKVMDLDKSLQRIFIDRKPKKADVKIWQP